MEYNVLSELLSVLMKKAEESSGSAQASATAERLLLALFDGITSALRADDGEDLEEAAAVVSEAFSDLGKTQQALTEYVKKNDYAFIDNLYMDKRLEVAMTLAARRKMPTVTVDVMLACILIQPSNIIKSCMKKGYSKKLAEAQTELFEINKQLTASVEEKLSTEEPSKDEDGEGAPEIIVEQIDMSVVEILAERGGRGDSADPDDEGDEDFTELASRMRAEIESEESEEDKKTSPEDESAEEFAKVVKAEIEADKAESGEETEPTPEEQADEEFAKVVKAEIEADKAESGEEAEPTPEEQADEEFDKVVKAEIEADKADTGESVELTPEKQADEEFAKVVRAEIEASRRRNADKTEVDEAADETEESEDIIEVTVSHADEADEDADEAADEAVDEADDDEAAEYIDDGERLGDFWNDDSEGLSRNKLVVLADGVKKLREELGNVVWGQQKAIDVFADGYFRSELLAMTDKDVWGCATFLFVGPEGVGKRFLAENVARLLERPFVRFDMSEFGENKLNASDSLMARLVDFISANPRAVVLFDKVENAGYDSVRTLVQIMDEGILHDNTTDETVGLGEVIFFFTTNAGKQVYDTTACGDLSDISQKEIIKALQGDVCGSDGTPYFPGELCARFASSSNVVMFNRLTPTDLCAIALRVLQHKAECFEEEFGISVSFDERIYSTLVLAEGGEADARAVILRAEGFFDGEIAELFKRGSTGSRGVGIDEMSDVSVRLDISDDNAEIIRIYESNEKTEMILFASKKVAQTCAEVGKDYRFHHIISGSKAEKLMQTHDVRFILVDLTYGAKKDAAFVDAIEIESSARSFFDRMRESCPDIPIYLLETENCRFKDEDRIAFERLGAAGFINVERPAGLVRGVRAALEKQRLDNAMLMLAKENKALTFKTSQSISKDCKKAEIYLYDLELRPYDTVSCGCDKDDGEEHITGLDGIIGKANAKKELKILAEYLKNPKKYLGSGLKAPGGILLYGPKGTGKTLLASAFIADADASLVVADGKMLSSTAQERGDEELHRLFRKAKKYAPSILFIDNVHAFLEERGAENLLNALIRELDGFDVDATRPTLVVATADVSDPLTLDRLSDSFDRLIEVEMPTAEDRKAFLNSRIWGNKALRITEEVVDGIARRSVGMTVAQLDHLVDLALRTAIREGKGKVNDDILCKCFDNICRGRMDWADWRIRRAAVHVAGHILASYACGIIPEYASLTDAATQSFANSESDAFATKAELVSRIRIALGGRAAELVCYEAEGGLSSLSGTDLKTATEIAKSIVCDYGMLPDVGLAALMSDAVLSDDVLSAINAILTEQLEAVKALMVERRDALDALIDSLTVKNYLYGREADELLKTFFKE